MNTVTMNPSDSSACRRNLLTKGVRALVYGSFVFLALACSSTERRVEDIVTYPTPSENPSDEIAKLQSEIDESRARNVNLLAPTWFASAEKSLNIARETQNSSGDYRKLFKRTAEGHVQIRRANEIAATSEKMVPDVLRARQRAAASEKDAVQAGATNLDDIKKAMTDADKQFIELTASIENNELGNMMERRQVAVRSYAGVEAKALQKGKLDTAKRVVEEAVRQGAKKFAPNALTYATEVIRSTEELISTNPKAVDDIERKSDESLFYARRALLFTQQSRDVAQRSPEDTVLWFEQSITSIADEAGASDMRDEALDNQVNELRSQVTALKSAPPVVTPRDAKATKNSRAPQRKTQKM